MKIGKLLLIGLPLSLVAGCVNSHHQRMAYTTRSVEVVPAPTSSSTVVRIYPDRTGPGVSEPDLAVAETVRHMIATDADLKAACRNVDIEVKNRRATLRGKVATERERELIRERIENLQGLDRIDDRLKVEYR